MQGRQRKNVCEREEEEEEETNLWVSSPDDWALTQQGQGEQERALHTPRVPDHGSPSSLALGNAERSSQSPTTITNQNWVLMGDECQRRNVRYIWGRVRAFKELTEKRGMRFPCCEAKFWKAQMIRPASPAGLAPLFPPLDSNGYFFFIIIFIFNINILN
jgi:hypothetical protein